MTLLHPPYTAWHLSYVAIGAAVAPILHCGSPGVPRWARSSSRSGSPRTRSTSCAAVRCGRGCRTAQLIALAAAGLAGATAIGAYGAATISLSLIPFTLAGVFLVLAYDLEWFGGRFHTDLWFAAAWGAFPAATGYWSNALAVRPAGVAAVAACFALSVAQRRLSSPVARAAPPHASRSAASSGCATGA